jgi:methylthioribose-1-phosphate isomerase
MRIGEKLYHTLWIHPEDDGIVQIIDQKKLPFAFSTMDLTTVLDAFIAIRDMYVRGAPLIGVTAAMGLYLGIKNEMKEVDFSLDEAQEMGQYLKTARPTAINLAYAVDEMLKALQPARSQPEAIEIAKSTALALLQKELEYCYQIGQHGLPLIEKISKTKKGGTVNILTHCNAGWLACIDYGTATAPIYMAHDKGIKVHVWVDETRPRNQGARLTAWELQQHGVPFTVIPDNLGGHLMQHGMVDLVIVGSDRTTVNGDVANKIGTYLKALAAADNNIPFYVALPSTTIDWEMEDGVKNIPIEQRDGDEVARMEGVNSQGQLDSVYILPRNAPVANYGFDVTPARLVNGLITEKGICQASKEALYALFPSKKK